MVEQGAVFQPQAPGLHGQPLDVGAQHRKGRGDVGDDATLERFVSAGVEAILRKPYEAEALIDQVRLALASTG